MLHMDVCMHLTIIIFIGHVDAAYKFYKTKCEDSIKRRGKTAEKQQRKRARERLTRVSVLNLCFVLFSSSAILSQTYIET